MRRRSRCGRERLARTWTKAQRSIAPTPAGNTGRGLECERVPRCGKNRKNRCTVSVLEVLGLRSGQRAVARPGAAVGLDARVRRHRPANHGRSLRRTLVRFHRRHAAARQCPPQLDGQRLRYDGTIGGGTDNHMFNVGARFSW